MTILCLHICVGGEILGAFKSDEKIIFYIMVYAKLSNLDVRKSHGMSVMTAERDSNH